MIQAITRDELLAEWSKLGVLDASDDGPAGFTAADIAAKERVSVNTAGKKIRARIAADQVEYAGKRRSRNVTGGIVMVPVYRVKAC